MGVDTQRIEAIGLIVKNALLGSLKKIRQVLLYFFLAFSNIYLIKHMIISSDSPDYQENAAIHYDTKKAPYDDPDPTKLPTPYDMQQAPDKREENPTGADMVAHIQRSAVGGAMKIFYSMQNSMKKVLGGNVGKQKCPSDIAPDPDKIKKQETSALWYKLLLVSLFLPIYSMFGIMISSFISFIMPFAAFWKYNKGPHWGPDETSGKPGYGDMIGEPEDDGVPSKIGHMVKSCGVMKLFLLAWIGTLIKWFFVAIIFGVLDFGYVLIKLLLVLIIAPIFDSFNSCLPNNRLFFPNIFWSFRNVILTIINLLIIFNAIDQGLPGEWITGYIAALVLIYFKFMKKKDPKAGLNRREVATLNMS
ncbi:MAG: hypothetical protein CML42_08145 [Rhodobacteraceae bacterium]|nr:hypothetical protein [Paracoccaceae bacterium]|tara:strand:- start:77490 stop:78572 length:1083 start_codon:yes stop_codon:yes gene_type:complete